MDLYIGILIGYFVGFVVGYFIACWAKSLSELSRFEERKPGTQRIYSKQGKSV